MIDFDRLKEQMGDLHEEEVLSIIREVSGSCPEQVNDALQALVGGMDIVGERFDLSEYFVGDLIFAGEIFTESMDLLRPIFSTTEIGARLAQKKVILATVEGDLHDIGKNIVKVVLEAKGFNVIDLGVNVSPTTIVNRTVEESAEIIALSAVLTSAVDSMQRTVEACVAAGIRDRVSIVIGGAGVNAIVAKRIKADFYGAMPEDTAAFCLSL